MCNGHSGVGGALRSPWELFVFIITSYCACSHSVSPAGQLLGEQAMTPLPLAFPWDGGRWGCSGAAGRVGPAPHKALPAAASASPGVSAPAAPVAPASPASCKHFVDGAQGYGGGFLLRNRAVDGALRLAVPSP